MKLKTFHGRTMAEALTQVKKHFGKDAIILSTRTLTRGGILGIGGRPHIEITATQEFLGLLKTPLRCLSISGSRLSPSVLGARPNQQRAQDDTRHTQPAGSSVQVRESV